MIYRLTPYVSPKLFRFSALKFQRFLSRQIKCRGNYMKIHFASALPRQYFCRGWEDFILRASAFTWATSAKTLTRSKLVRLLALLHIFTRNKKYYVYNSIQKFKRSLVYIQSKAPSSICSGVRNDNYNPFHVLYMKNNRFTSQSSLLSIWR